MADPEKANAGKEIFEKIREKLALALALLVLPGYPGIGLGMNGVDPDLAHGEKEKVDPAKGTYFLLEREVNGSGKWEVLAEKLDTKTQVYVDTKIEPKTKYAYRVSLFSTEKNFLDRGGKVDPIVGATPNTSGLVNVVTGPAALTLGI